MNRLICITLVLAFSLLVPRSATAADPVALLLEAPSAARIVAEYLGVVESTNSKLERLIDADLKTAVSLFEQAKTNPEKSKELLKDARVYFTRAAEIQSDSMDETRRHKRALALLGLWACCKSSNDDANAQLALTKIHDMPWQPSNGLAAKYGATNPLGTFSTFARMYSKKDPFALIEAMRKSDKNYNSFLSIQFAVAKKIKKTHPYSLVKTLVALKKVKDKAKAK